MRIEGKNIYRYDSIAAANLPNPEEIIRQAKVQIVVNCSEKIGRKAFY
jgi:hypothetical protein